MQLAQAEITQQNKQKYLISGTLDFSTVPGLMRQMAGFFKSYKQASKETIVVDLSQVTDCNSAGLALILEMAKDIPSINIDLHFENLPDTLLTIAKSYGVENEIRELCK